MAMAMPAVAATEAATRLFIAQFFPQHGAGHNIVLIPQRLILWSMVCYCVAAEGFFTMQGGLG